LRVPTGTAAAEGGGRVGKPMRNPNPQRLGLDIGATGDHAEKMGQGCGERKRSCKKRFMTHLGIGRDREEGVKPGIKANWELTGAHSRP